MKIAKIINAVGIGAATAFGISRAVRAAEVEVGSAEGVRIFIVPEKMEVVSDARGEVLFSWIHVVTGTGDAWLVGGVGVSECRVGYGMLITGRHEDACSASG